MNFWQMPPAQQAAYLAEITKKAARADELEQRIKLTSARQHWAEIGGETELPDFWVGYFDFDEDYRATLDLEKHAPLKRHLKGGMEPAAQGNGNEPWQKVSEWRSSAAYREYQEGRRNG